MKISAKLHASTTTSAARLAARLAVAGAIAIAVAAATGGAALAADDVTVPLPSVRWDPIENGTTVPNTGTREGFENLTDGTLLLRKATTRNLATCAPGDLVTADGAGPFGLGRAIDFSANPRNGFGPVANTDPALAGPLAGLIASQNGGIDLDGARDFTVTLWYKLDSSLTAEGRYVTFFRHNAFGFGFLSNGGPSFSTSVKSAFGTFGTARLDCTPNSTTLQSGKWVFLAGTWNGATGQISVYYGNEELPVAMLKTNATTTRGVLGDPSTTPNPFMNLCFHNFDGAPGDSNGRCFDGLLADIRFYSAALSPEQVEKVRSGSAASSVTTYLPAVKSWTDTALANDYTEAKVDAATAAAAPNGVTNDRLFHAAAAAARLWLLGGKTDRAYADRAFYILKALRAQRALNLALPNTRFDIGFQTRFSFAETCDILIKNDYTTLNPEFDDPFIADLKEMARASLGPGDITDNNSGAFYAAGTVRALTLWPELDAGGAWTDYVKAYWANWTARHDTHENSLNYNKVFLSYNILLAQYAADVPGLDAAAMRADLAHPGTRAMVTRWRDQMSGAGNLPFYGDDGNGTPLLGIDSWPANFEWAAKTYADPTFRWAANAWWSLVRNHASREPMALFLMTYADEWGDLSVTPVQPAPAPALVQTRPTAHDPAESDKIVLAPSRDRGAPFTLAEIFSHGWHSHMEQVGAIYSHEHNSTVFLYGLGYNNRTSDQASMVLINPATLPFPWRGYPQNDIWYEAAIPTDRLSEITDTTSSLYGTGGRHIIDQPLWRFEQHHPTESGTGWLADWRLVAADGTEEPITPSPLSATTGWPSGAAATFDTGPDGTAGAALRFTLAPQVNQNQSTFLKNSAHLNHSVLPAEHPYIKFWWKVNVPAISGGNNPSDQIIGYREDYYDGGERSNGAGPWLQPFAPATTAAKAESTAGVRYGSFTIDGYFTVATKLTRRIVQLDDGTLVVHDTLHPDAAADGRNAGPVWQLDATPAPVQVAPGIYDATGFLNTRALARGTDHLLVVMERAPGRDFGSVHPPSPLWMNTNIYATYARSTLRAGVPVSFVTVLLPNDGSTPAATLATRVRITRLATDNIVVQLDAPAGGAAAVTTQITLAAGDEWSVDTIAPPAPATLTLSDLFQAYDGEPKPVTVTTDPAGLSTLVFYGEERTTTPPTEIGAYPVVAQITAPGYHGEATGTLRILAPSAYIIEQPLPRVAAAGDTVTLSALVSGRQPITYLWEKSADGQSGWTTAGTGETLTLANVTDAAEGFYRLTVTNNIGDGDVSAISRVIELAVIADPFPAPVPDGAAHAATGGGAGAGIPEILVTNEDDLRAYAALDTPATLILRDNIILTTGPLILGSDKTLQGFDADAALVGQLQIGPAAQNVIVRGLTLSNPDPSAPALAITAATDIYLANLSLFATNPADGPLATIDTLSDAITLAWSELYFTGTDGARSALLAGDDAGIGTPAITLHHNLWKNAAGAAPLVQNANVHLYDNIYTGTGDATPFAIAAGAGASVLVEYNFFRDIATPVARADTAALVNVNYTAYAGSSTAAPGTFTDTVFAPSYPYLTQSATAINALLADAVGNTAGAASALPPDAGTGIALTITGTEGRVHDSARITLTGTLTGAAPLRGAPAAWGAPASRGQTDGVPPSAPITPSASSVPSIPSVLSLPSLPSEPTPGAAAPPSTSTSTSTDAAAVAAGGDGGGVTYQWYRNRAKLDDDNDYFTGVTTPELTIPYALQILSGAYTLQATLENGDTAISNARLITIGPPVRPDILTPPRPTDFPDLTDHEQPYEIGETVSLFIKADGDPVLKYQWQRNGANIPGANGPVLNLGAVKIDDGGVYRVIVANNSGTATSTDFTLKVTNFSAPYRVGNSRGDSNGGGALSPWCAAALALLAAARLRRKSEPIN